MSGRVSYGKRPRRNRPGLSSGVVLLSRRGLILERGQALRRHVPDDPRERLVRPAVVRFGSREVARRPIRLRPDWIGDHCAVLKPIARNGEVLLQRLQGDAGKGRVVQHGGVQRREIGLLLSLEIRGERRHGRM